MDGDGDIDVLAASKGFGETSGITVGMVTWYENDGSQNWTSHTIATVESSVFAQNVTNILGFETNISGVVHFGASSVFAIDVDGDGDIDVLSALTRDNTVAVYENVNAAPAAPLCPSSITSETPSWSPSTSPSASPSASPSLSPSTSPSASPSVSPSASPSTSPSASPSVSPSASPSASPRTKYPTVTPSKFPTPAPAPLPAVLDTAPGVSAPSGDASWQATLTTMATVYGVYTFGGVIYFMCL